MLDFMRGYWSKNPQKEKTLVMLIDNHKSKCLYADKILKEHLKDGKLIKNLNFIQNSKILAKSKKLSKKSKKNKKKTSKKIINKDQMRMLTNSSQSETNLCIDETKEESNQPQLNSSKIINHKIFYYKYNNENINYKR
jgi:hypothetical protein